MCIKVLFLFLAFSVNLFGKEIKVPETMYSPVFKDPSETNIEIGPLLVDETPVTNKEFLKFIKANPQMAKSKLASLFADKGYLNHWTSDTTFNKVEALYPVTNVSWFVARKYCIALGKRLPTIAEWETFSDAQNPKIETKILAWYSKPGLKITAVGQGRGNKFGIKNTHGLVWEWVENFSEAIMSGDSRGGSSTDSLFCGGAALKAKDPSLYATFIRFAFRSSLTAQYNSANLGFRCVKNNEEGLK